MGLIRRVLGKALRGASPLDVPAAWVAMQRAVRNLGRQGLCASAIAAVDSALWDLKARLLDLPLVTLLGAAQNAVPVYGSGGFTSYPIDVLQKQLAGWVDAGITRVKMKVGRDAEADPGRVRAARDGVSPSSVQESVATLQPPFPKTGAPSLMLLPRSTPPREALPRLPPDQPVGHFLRTHDDLDSGCLAGGERAAVDAFARGRGCRWMIAAFVGDSCTW